MDTKQIGDIAEAHVIVRLTELGYTILEPRGDNARYDLVIETPEGFKKGQIKNGRLQGQTISFNTCSIHGRKRKRRSYEGHIDVFWVYCKGTGKVYEVPISKAPKTEMLLRLGKTRNGQTVRHQAQSFEL